MEIVGARWRRLPVKVTEPVEKGRILEAARQIHQVHVTAPVKIGQVLIKDFLGEKGIDVVACRSMDPIVLKNNWVLFVISIEEMISIFAGITLAHTAMIWWCAPYGLYTPGGRLPARVCRKLSGVTYGATPILFGSQCQVFGG